jgi:hypothetical protein
VLQINRSPNGADCVLNSKELPMFIDLAVDQPYDRQQIARDSSLVIFNLLHWSADRVTDLLGDSLSTWIESGPSELFCGLDAASSPPMPVRMYSGNGGGFT